MENINVADIVESLLIVTGQPIEVLAEDFSCFNKAVDSFIAIGFTESRASELVSELWTPIFER